MLRAGSPVAFLATTDAGRARVFHGDALGLPFVADEEVALVFDLSGIPLRVARVEVLRPQPFTVLGWRVDDVEAAVRGRADRGGGLRTVRRPGAGRPGDLAHGNVLSVSRG